MALHGNALPRGARLGRFRIDSEIGRGGMGVVYRAVDETTGEAVALKVLLPEVAQEKAFILRADREARLAATVRHPNVARLLHAGELDGQRVLAFELVPGGSLADRLKERGALPWREAASFGAGIARALEAVHAAGLVHRDLKPANVLLGAGDVPKLADFGLARQLSRQSRLTQTGEVLGTPAYMAPEQLEAAKDAGASADVYALGATIFALLSGRPPFDETGVSLVKKVLVDRPPRVRELAPHVPPELDALVARLLAKNPAARGDAARAARELEGLAAPGAKSSAGAMRRAPALALGIALVLVIAIVLVVSRAGGGPPPRPPVATDSSGAPPSPSLGHSAAPAPRALEPALALELAPLLAFERQGWRLVTAWGDGRWKHADDISSAVFLPDGRLLTGSLDSSVRLWDMATGTYVPLEGPEQPNFSVAVSHDGKVAAAGGGERTVFVWDDLDHPRPARQITGFEGTVRSLAFSRQGTLYVASNQLLGDQTHRGKVAVFRQAAGGAAASREVEHEISTVALAGPEQRVFAACSDGKVRTWDAETLEGPGESPRLHAWRITALALSPDGKRALTASEPRYDSEGAARRSRLWDLPDWHESATRIESGDEASYAVALSSDGTLAATSEKSGAVTITDLDGHGRSKKLQCGGGWPDAIAFEPRTGRLVVCPWGAIDIWDLNQPQAPRNRGTIAQRASYIRSICPSKDGRRALVGSSLDSGVNLVDLATGSGLGHATLDEGCHAVAFAADGQALAASRALVVHRFQPGDLAPISSQAMGNDDLAHRAIALAFSSNGARLFGALDDQDPGASSFKSWKLAATGDASSFVYDEAKGRTLAVAVSADGRRAVTGAADGRVFLWDIERDALVEPHPTRLEIQGVAVSRTGKRYAWGGREKVAHIIERVGSKETELDAPLAFRNDIFALAFSPDEDALAVSSHDGRVLVWDVKRSRPLATLDLATTGGIPHALAWANDRTLLVGTERGLLLVVALER